VVLSIRREKLSNLESVFLEPITRSSVLSVFNSRKVELSQDFISCKQEMREGGGNMEFGLLER